MASNSFGNLFRITTWGESHGKAIGVVIDGCPALLPITEEEIQIELRRRSPGNSPYTSPRKEEDQVQILSGVFEGKTTGAPISILIWNQDADSSQYESIRHLLRPGHANYTYLQKYGIFDYRGGGRSSARETASRVAAGSIAKKLLRLEGVEIIAYIRAIGDISSMDPNLSNVELLKSQISTSPVFCHDPIAAEQMMERLLEEKKQGDSLGGLVESAVLNLPSGIGDPVYEKLEANLAKAMLSIPASKGIEFGSGFASAQMRGSEHNDRFILADDSTVSTETNHAGGTLGGISTGAPIIFRVPFKPTSSILKPQKTLDIEGKEADLILSKTARHDPCVAIRAVPIVEAMAALTIADAMLMRFSCRLPTTPPTCEPLQKQRQQGM